MALILTISTVTIGLLPVSVAAASFTDVPDDAYYAESVAWAVDKGITKGTSDSTFSPDNGCTRAQVVTFLWRAAGQPDATKTSGFLDVEKGEYYTKAVSWAVEKEITKGIGDGKFDPDSTCTRAQIVTFLWRYKESPLSSKDSGFTDVSTDQYYAEPVTWAVQNEITQGVGNNQFAPNNTCTRAQVVTFLHRTSQVKQDNLNDDIIDYGDLQDRVEDGTIEVTLDKNGNDRWNHGEDSGEIDRSFSNPSLYEHANHYRAVTESKNVGSYWYKELEQYVDRDYEGVHIFSGIVNHAAYLMMTDSRTSGVSKDTWAKVFYNSMYRLQTDSLFTNHRGAIIAAAKKLGFTSLQQQAIVIGSPSYAVLITPDLHAWLLTATEQLQMAGKLGGAFATEQYTHGGGDLVIQSILTNMRMTRPLPPFHGSRSIPHLDNHKPYGKVFNIFFYIH